MNLTPFVVFWSLLAMAVLGLALYRKIVANHEEDYIRIGAGEEKLIPQQLEMAARLKTLDRWGGTLTAATAIFGLLIAAAYLWAAWEASLRH